MPADNPAAASIGAPAKVPFAAWHVLDDPVPRAGPLNMAVDHALLERAARGEHWLRLYRWEPACLSFGRHERAATRYDRDRITALGIDVVRRPTGGRAVWHAGELTYAIAAPEETVGTLRAAYREIHAVLRAALAGLGAEAILADPVPVDGLEAGACFARPVGGEIVIGGRKVVGSAQLRHGRAVLQHGSILLRDDQDLVRRVTRGPAPPDGSAPLERLLGRAVAAEDVAASIAGAAAGRWGGSWSATEPTAILVDAHRHLPRYGSAAWTWRA